MIIKKIVTLICITVISSLLISCAGKNSSITENVSITENITKVKNTDVYLTAFAPIDKISKITTVTNEEIVNTILTDIKWSENKLADGTIQIYATGKYKDIELVKKYASITPLFFIAILSDEYVEWDKLGDQERTETITLSKETANTFLKLADSSEVIFKFDLKGNFQENKDDKFIFNSLVFFGYTINLSGMDKAMGLPPLNAF